MDTPLAFVHDLDVRRDHVLLLPAVGGPLSNVLIAHTQKTTNPSPIQSDHRRMPTPGRIPADQ